VPARAIGGRPESAAGVGPVAHALVVLYQSRRGSILLPFTASTSVLAVTIRHYTRDARAPCFSNCPRTFGDWYYGQRKLLVELRRDGVVLNRKGLRRLMSGAALPRQVQDVVDEPAAALACEASVSAAQAEAEGGKPSLVRRHHLPPDRKGPCLLRGGGDGHGYEQAGQAEEARASDLQAQISHFEQPEENDTSLSRTHVPSSIKNPSAKDQILPSALSFSSSRRWYSAAAFSSNFADLP
jgi:hypothetical protein